MKLTWKDPNDGQRRVLWKNEKRGQSGKLDESKLVSIGSGPRRKLIAPAAEMWNKMKEACRKDTGHTMGAQPSTYRSWAYQSQVCAAKANTDSYCGSQWRASLGGTSHGWGRGVDVNMRARRNQYPESKESQEIYEWLKVNARLFGFVNYSKEAWHWEFMGLPIKNSGNQVNPAVLGEDEEYTGGTEQTGTTSASGTAGGTGGNDYSSAQTSSRVSAKSVYAELQNMFDGKVSTDADANDKKVTSTKNIASNPDVKNISSTGIKLDETSINIEATS